MKSNLLNNLKEYWTKMKKKYPNLNVKECLNLLEENQNELEELLLESEMKEYDLRIKEDEYGNYDMSILFHYNSPNVVYNLSITSSTDSFGEKIYDLNIFRTQRTMCKSSLKNAVTYEQYTDDETEEERKANDDESKLYQIANIQEQIAWKNKYIELEVKRLNMLVEQLSELGA